MLQTYHDWLGMVYKTHKNDDNLEMVDGIGFSILDGLENLMSALDWKVTLNATHWCRSWYTLIIIEHGFPCSADYDQIYHVY